jgi:predicted ATP-dependent serine protease
MIQIRLRNTKAFCGGFHISENLFVCQNCGHTIRFYESWPVFCIECSKYSLVETRFQSMPYVQQRRIEYYLSGVKQSV